mmetsp:Transcript_6955/g.8811  ORF Transcript_6955/g.8811 Transcript_6955/m.8811 type:complete len:140 (-) Transcript_6955:118-537(-)
MIRESMAKYGRKEELIIFTGQDNDGNLLPLIDQYNIFRRASTIIGPHGSGIANNIWTYPFPDSCEDRVHMLEFIPASDSSDVQIIYTGYYWVMRGMPIDWHQVFYASNSTKSTPYLYLPDIQNALDDMWGQSPAIYFSS